MCEDDDDDDDTFSAELSGRHLKGFTVSVT
jgi:hypothetical protein